MFRCLVFVLVLFTLGSCSTSLSRALTQGFPTTVSYKNFPARVIGRSQVVSAIPVGVQLSPETLVTVSGKGSPRTLSLNYLEEVTKTEALLIIRDGKIIYEDYRLGTSRDTLRPAFSVTKSFLSTLIGIAIEDRKIKGLSDDVISYIPELKGRGVDTLTIRDLVDMSSGIDYTKVEQSIFPLFSDDIETFYGDNLRKTALGLRHGSLPLRTFYNYNDYYPLLEGIILERVTGKQLSNFFEEKIWKPLGTEYDATWTLDSVNGDFERAHVGLNGRAIDFARFGLLFLNHGRVASTQIINPIWVDDATKVGGVDSRTWLVDQDWRSIGGYYKYHWWGIDFGGGSYAYMAHGNLDQMIYVSPESKIVVVRFGSQGDQNLRWPIIARGIVQMFLKEGLND